MSSPELKLVHFFLEYSKSLVEEISSTRSQLDVAITHAMEVVREFSHVTEQKKDESEAMMDKAYLSPDEDMLKMMNYTQKSADNVFELAKAGALDQSVKQAVNLRDVANDMRLMSGVFSKHMESMSRIEDETRNIFLSMVGLLSNGDVMTQRLEHVFESLDKMNEKLRVMIDTSPEKLSFDEVSSMKDSVLEDTYRRYRLEDDKVDFKLVFGPPPHIVRAYQRRSG